MNYFIDNILSIIGGHFLHRQDNAPIEQLLIDSRKLIFPHTSLFFALHGPRRDGHDFIGSLYAKGVRNFVVSQPVDTSSLPGANIIQVADSLEALQALAAWHRSRFAIPVLGITGSNGKTMVKEWLNQLLDTRYAIIRSPKSYNSQLGVPLSVWAMNEHHELAIFEAGISTRGEMEKLADIIQPTIGIFTNIGEAHSEGFDSIAEKVREKLQLFRQAGTLIYCRDMPELQAAIIPFAGEHPGLRLVSWGRSAEATLQVTSITSSRTDTVIQALYQQRPQEISIPFTDAASIENALHCWCLLLQLEVPATVIRQQLAQLSHVAMRLEMKNGINNCSVINDSYSADLSSFAIALDFLSQQAQHPRRTVILSDILQSGRTEQELYAQVAQALHQRGIDRLIGIGQTISRQEKIFKQAGIPAIHLYATVAEFKAAFHQLHFHDESILLKGARVFEFEAIDRLLEQKVHQTVLEIDLNAVVSNLKHFQQLLRPETKLMAMVKAFSYGSGSFEIANVLQFHKVDYLAVAYADEGVELRKGGIDLPVMVMNVDESTFDVLVQYDLEPDLYAPGLLRSFAAFLKRQGIQQYPVHIELETGMNRLGFSLSQLPELLEALQGNLFKVQSVFSHLAASEDPQHDNYTRQQYNIFLEMVARLQQAAPYPFIRHISNTGGISRHPDLQLDMVRLGIGLYGIDSGEVHGAGLQEVSTLKSTIAQIKELKEGETVSYGRRGVVTRKSRIATVRIGYADGYPRALGNGVGKVWVNGRLAPVMGTVCMDMTMIDITGMPSVMEGDEVELFGKNLPVQEVARWAGTIPYTLLTGVSQRVKRVYFQE
ncbi:MAG: bifunctional UDP-N-acetylmuramoyl-tripeptide:D-alanyl-D-alanine ligase/alanine racemase [Candidatus Pseudobacter hemicellulosilyticus]|uniref:Alanine racemase n=1 Tax=Candidatus Pseudobacter hemicellulosilyticus TaxID=3121375 RepID=A0AAJ5WTB1_9BACT|nr:MAG: bifunctional UDP-N-acetylmuramoyl-tripeptide:D-alanyl-D-alanine ligase/alanine racemase [Pseudobacter sp.]